MRRRNALLALVLAAACTAAIEIPRNRYGLAVVGDVATLARLVRHDPDKRLVDLSALGLALDLRYATTDNFMKRPLYPVARAFLRAPAARALAEANRELAARALGLRVLDAYRPYGVTERMWEPIRNTDFVADPAQGSRHNRGAAVDVTLIDLRSGSELAMPTPYDDFTPRARHDYLDLPPEAIANRATLRDTMVAHGFMPLASEWWHYDYRGWERFELLDVPLEALAAPAAPL